MDNGDSSFFGLVAEQMFLQLPEIYETFESRSAECAAQSCTSTAQWHWPSGDRVFTDLDQFRLVNGTNCRTTCMQCSMSALVLNASFLLSLQQHQAGYHMKNSQSVHSASMMAIWHVFLASNNSLLFCSDLQDLHQTRMTWRGVAKAVAQSRGHQQLCCFCSHAKKDVRVQLSVHESCYICNDLCMCTCNVPSRLSCLLTKPCSLTSTATHTTFDIIKPLCRFNSDCCFVCCRQRQLPRAAFRIHCLSQLQGHNLEMKANLLNLLTTAVLKEHNVL